MRRTLLLRNRSRTPRHADDPASYVASSYFRANRVRYFRPNSLRSPVGKTLGDAVTLWLSL